jgi:hypothetical protein
MHGKSILTAAMSAATSLLLVVVLATAAGAQGRGGGGGGGGTGGGGGGGTGGGEAPDLGDLFILYRGADGVPILTPEGCQQPLAAPGVALPAVGEIPACTPATPAQSCVIPVDPVTCAVMPGYESYTQEVDFGRTSVIRSPDTVLDTQMEDVLVNLASADCITLDAAGRLVTSTVAGGVTSTAEIDSPLQNLSIYRQLMLTGYIGTAGAPIQLPAAPLITAGRSLGAAADKLASINVDMVAYINQILGLTDETVATFLPKKCITVREEVRGVVQTVRKCFLDYGAFAYGRAANFDWLPSPPYIPAAGPVAGWFEYLAVSDPTVPTFAIGQGSILAVVPQLAANPALAASNIGGFAQAADDARAVIEYMHSWPVPGTYPTPVACTASREPGYDLSISSESGLQVPVKMVAGTEGREFTLTVANAGPDVATGSVTLTATDSAGASLPTFPRSYSFTLLAGAQQTWTEQFSAAYATTVTWTATAVGEFELNPVNNTVTQTTQVIGKGGGGRR